MTEDIKPVTKGDTGHATFQLHRQAVHGRSVCAPPAPPGAVSIAEGQAR